MSGIDQWTENKSEIDQRTEIKSGIDQWASPGSGAPFSYGERSLSAAFQPFANIIKDR